MGYIDTQMSMTYTFYMPPENIMPENGLVFVESATFESMADEYLGDKGREILQDELLENPEADDVIAGTDGARKIRVALEGRGKRGGVRVIYFYRHTRGALFFLAMYPKNEKSDLSSSDKKALKDRVRKIIRGNYP